jgi:hypothetical protein
MVFGRTGKLRNGNDVHGLSGVEVAGVLGAEDGLDHEDEFGAVLAVVEHGRRVFGLWRHEADDGVERRATVEVDADAPAGLEGGEGGLGDEEADFDVFRRQ